MDRGAAGRGYSTLTIALRFADGAVGSLLGSYDSSYAYGRTHSLEINGTKGRVATA
jgi:myo-inositol 2-dehydrogenase / D-chiro-inositol 1-dehydrogenase